MRNFLKGRLLFVRICLLTSVCLLVLAGIVTIYFVGHPAETSPVSSKAIRELAGFWRSSPFRLVGVGGFVGVNLVNYRRLGAISHWLFGVILVLLVYLDISGHIMVPCRCPGDQRRLLLDQAGNRLVGHPAVRVVQAGLYSGLGMVSSLPQQLPQFSFPHRSFCADLAADRADPDRAGLGDRDADDADFVHDVVRGRAQGSSICC